MWTDLWPASVNLITALYISLCSKHDSTKLNSVIYVSSILCYLSMSEKNVLSSLQASKDALLNMFWLSFFVCLIGLIFVLGLLVFFVGFFMFWGFFCQKVTTLQLQNKVYRNKIIFWHFLKTFSFQISYNLYLFPHFPQHSLFDSAVLGFINLMIRS